MKMSFEWPELAGMHEVAAIMKVSGARVWQLYVDDPAFPEPIAHLRATKVWAVSDVVKYDLARNKKGGRRRKVKPE